MQGYPGSKAADQYLAQRVEGASPEQLVAILLEGGQKFLNLLLAAMAAKDVPAKARHANRVSDIILELSLRLNREDGGEVVDNLERIYKWWMDELFEAARKDEPNRLETMRNQMNIMRNTWEERHRKNVLANKPAAPAASLNEMVG
jgi:flagellar biosynthetic protein FliS